MVGFTFKIEILFADVESRGSNSKEDSDALEVRGTGIVERLSVCGSALAISNM